MAETKSSLPLFTLDWVGRDFDYLASIDAEANEMYESLIVEFAKTEDIDENLKATNQMQWVQRDAKHCQPCTRDR